MSDKTKIQWCDYTFNPWEGCSKVSPGCANCYAESRNRRWNGGEAVNWGKGAPRRRTSTANWSKPLAWNKAAARNGTRPRVFCASLADWLDDEVPLQWLSDLYDLICGTPNLDWLLLTKRPENFRPRLEKIRGWRSSAGWWAEGRAGCVPNNVWLGTSAEDQTRWDERIPVLMSIPAKVRFVSAEPLMGPIVMGARVPDWVIVGGESGAGARAFDLHWALGLQDQCHREGCEFYMKQIGANAKVRDWGWATKDAKGGDPWEWPLALRVREFPKTEALRR